MRVQSLCRRWAFAGGLTVGLIAMALPTVSLAAVACVTSKDLAALNARVLQTELMVAALTCGEKARYNAFVMSFKGVLGDHGRSLRALFTRVHGSSGKRQLNGFVTKLANDASQGTLAVPGGYCTMASDLFEEVLSTPPDNFDAMAEKPWIRNRHGFPPCTRSAVTGTEGASAQAQPLGTN